MHDSTYDYPAPLTREQEAQMRRVRQSAKVFSEMLEKELPDGPDKTWVIRNHRTTVMWASIALLRHPDGAPRL